MELRRIERGEASYPTSLTKALGESAPSRLTTAGNLALLNRKPLALFCSAKCPGSLILQTYDFVRELCESPVTFIGGFHSPMEQECLAIILRANRPVIICPARGMPRRIPAAWKQALAAERMLLLTQFDEAAHRMTTELARQRNCLVAALADRIFIAHAAPGSKTEAFAREVLGWGKPVLHLDDTTEQLP